MFVGKLKIGGCPKPQYLIFEIHGNLETNNNYDGLSDDEFKKQYRSDLNEARRTRQRELQARIEGREIIFSIPYPQDPKKKEVPTR